MRLSELKVAIEKYHNNVGKMRKAMSGVFGRGINALTGYDFSQSTQIAALEKYLQTKFPLAITNPDVSLADFEKSHGELSKTFLTSGSESAKLFIHWVANDTRLEEKQAESKKSQASMQLIPTGENAFALPVLGVKSDSHNLLSTVCRYIAAQNGDVISFSHFRVDQSHPLYQATELRIKPASTTLADSQLDFGTFNVLLLMIVKPNVVYTFPRAGLFELTLNLPDVNGSLLSSMVLQSNTASLVSHTLNLKPFLNPSTLDTAIDLEPLALPPSVAMLKEVSLFRAHAAQRELAICEHQRRAFEMNEGLPSRPTDGESGLYALPHELLTDFEYSDESSRSNDKPYEQELSNFSRSSF